MKDKKVKQVLSKGRCQWEGSRKVVGAKRKGKGRLPINWYKVSVNQ
jgi:hypothetical protein